MTVLVDFISNQNQCSISKHFSGLCEKRRVKFSCCATFRPKARQDHKSVIVQQLSYIAYSYFMACNRWRRNRRGDKKYVGRNRFWEQFSRDIIQFHEWLYYCTAVETTETLKTKRPERRKVGSAQGHLGANVSTFVFLSSQSLESEMTYFASNGRSGGHSMYSRPEAAIIYWSFHSVSWTIIHLICDDRRARRKKSVGREI